MIRKLELPRSKPTKLTRYIRESLPTEVERQEANKKFVYTGSPYHKRDPGDFNLTPPASPRPDKSLCDASPVRTKAEAQRLLSLAAQQGLWDRRTLNGVPSIVWCVEDSFVYEAQLENKELAQYHGYPLPSGDPYREKILQVYGEFFPK